LLAAVLRRAVKDILSYGGSVSGPNRRLAEEAWGWVRDEDTEHHLTSFVNLCHELGLNPYRVREAITDLERQGDTAGENGTALSSLP